MKRTAKTTTTNTDIAKAPEPVNIPPAAAAEQTTQVPLTDRLRDIRSEALRNSSSTSDVISRLHAQREQLEEMCREIDATISFLRAQRKGK